MEFINSNWFSGLIGALIGGGFSLVATHINHKFQRNNTKEQAQKELKAYLGAIHSEVNILHNRYAEQLKKEILNDLPSLLRTYTVHPHIFEIFNKNLHKIGQVETELREKIIKCYKTAIAFVDTLEINNIILKEFEEASHSVALASNPSEEKYYIALKENRENELVNIKKEQLLPTFEDLLAQMEELIPLLEKVSN